jgi:PhoH-like ATPase
MRFIILDTNIPLSNADNIVTLGQEPGVTIVLPETVLAELDNKKGGFEEINYQARATARLLASAEIVSNEAESYGNKTTLKIGDQTVLVIGLSAYKANPHEYGGNDQRIIETAKALMEAVSADDEVVLMSIDYYMRLRAQAVGVKTADFKIVEDAECEFVKYMEIADEEVFRTLHDTSVYVIDIDHKPENYSYKFNCESIGQMKLATIVNGTIKVLGKETEQKLREQDCPPINSEQLLATKAIQDPLVDLVLIEGQAGSGKNVVALSNAIRLLKTNKDKYQQIVYIRNPIKDEERGEDIGYLSGNDEKYAVYLGPIEDTIDFIVRQKIKPKSGDRAGDLEIRVQEGIEKLKAECNIDAIITTGLRGRTFHNAIVIMDEWQNASQATAQKALTRIGKSCKVIVTGSNKQIDSKYVTKYNNGLSVLLNEARKQTIDTNINMFAIELKKVVRSEMAMFAEELFTKR